MAPLWQSELDENLARWREAMRPIDEAAKRWQESMRPVQEAVARIARQFDFKAFAPLTRHFEWLAEQQKQCEQLEASGWLPHRSSPFHLIRSNGDEADTLNEAVHAYYQEQWENVREDFAAGISSCDIDDEAKQTFAEALAAHSAGLYRCAPRLLYPEIERVARLEIHGGALDKMASQDRLRQLVGELCPADMASTGVPGLRFYRALTEHLYAHMKDADAVTLAASNPVPNRHAALHGIVSYRSERSSLNAIIVADYLFQAISVLKRLSAGSANEPTTR